MVNKSGTFTMRSSFVDKGWNAIFQEAAQQAREEILVISPFIQLSAAKALFGQGRTKFKIITRFNLGQFYEGVSDLEALEFLINRGAKIKGILNLHAKVYIFDTSKAIVTSANLTQAALLRNHEFGLVTGNKELISKACEYFASLWGKAGDYLTTDQLLKWKKDIDEVKRTSGIPNRPLKLCDYGKDLGIPPQKSEEAGDTPTPSQWFVKFFGISSDRASRSLPVFYEVQRSGCNWACTYPKGKRPRQVKDGAVMFIGRLVQEPNDILIFGRAVGTKHVPKRDDATEVDIKLRSWKAQWQHYIRVRDAEFVAGALGNGISLNELMKKFECRSFVPTLRNKESGRGNTDPRRAYMQQPAVELTGYAAEWLNKQLDGAIKDHGRLSDSDLATLDWPAYKEEGN